MKPSDSRVGAGTLPRSHALIVVSQNEEKREREILALAKSAVCESGTACGICRHCKLAERGIHPDIIFIDRLFGDKGKQKREIAVGQIRQMVSEAFVLPQEAERKVFCIREANRMNPQAQNAALKVLEEPPRFVRFILGTSSPRELLATVRSRCEAIFVGGESKAISDELAEEYLSLAAKGDIPGFCAFCVSCENQDSQRISEMLSAAQAVLSGIISGHDNSLALSRQEAMRILEIVVRSREYLRLNVSVKHLLGMLSVLTIGG